MKFLRTLLIQLFAICTGLVSIQAQVIEGLDSTMMDVFIRLEDSLQQGTLKVELARPGDRYCLPPVVTRQLINHFDSIDAGNELVTTSVALSIAQAPGFSFSYDGSSAESVMRLLDSNTRFDKISRKHPEFKVSRDTTLYVVNSRWDNKLNLSAIEVDRQGDYGSHIIDSEISLAYLIKSGAKNLYYSPRSLASTRFLSGVHLLRPLSIDTLPESYIKSITYKTKIAPNGLNVKLPGAKVVHRKREGDSTTAFTPIDWLWMQLENNTSNNDQDAKRSAQRYDQWGNTLREYHSILRREFDFNNSSSDLKSALAWAYNGGGHDVRFEQLVAPFIPASDLLRLKRMRQSIGFDNFDTQPFTDAYDISKLAAESLQPDLFLVAYLAATAPADGVFRNLYTISAVKTEPGVLEALEIRLFDLAIGSAFEYSQPTAFKALRNPAHGAFLIGRSLKPTDPIQYQQYKSKLIEVVVDTQLDYYNRLIGYELLSGAVAYETSKFNKLPNDLATLENCIRTFPSYLRSSLLERIAHARKVIEYQSN